MINNYSKSNSLSYHNLLTGIWKFLKSLVDKLTHEIPIHHIMQVHVAL